MKIKVFHFNMFSVNTYLVWDEASRECAIVDPGMISRNDNDEISDFITRNGLDLKYLVNTHLHIDHTFGNDFISKVYNLPTYAHPADDFLGKQRAAQARMFGLGLDASALTIGHELADGEKLWLGKEYMEVIEVPGHSPGSVALYSPTGRFVITGDALFQGSIGRTDLPGGNHSQLIKSVTERLLTLPDDTTVYPGHGPKSTIGEEKNFNPFV